MFSIDDVISLFLSITIGYLAISFLHIVVGELIPKSIAIRRTEKSALFISYPITFFRFLFFVPIWVLNSTVNVILKIFKIPVKIAKDRHSEDEVRVILDQSQSSGVMSFRRLLYIENVLDLGNLTVRNAMRQRERVCTINTGSAREDVNRIITKNKFSRYPLIDTITSEPIGFVHVKDLYHAIVHTNGKFDISDYLRPALKTTQDEPLEKLMASMQRKGNHMATVHDSNNAWLGIITLEDAIEEVIGTIEEEYPIEQLVHLSDFLRGSHLLLGIKGTSIITAVRNALHSINQKELPIIVDDIISHIADRERIASTYVGHRLAIPHARLTTISQLSLLW